MKSFVSVLLLLALMLCFIPSSFSEISSVAAYSYDFDMMMHLNAEAFPARVRPRIEGYAELINMLELKGNLTVAANGNSFDLSLEIIPVTNKNASVSFHIFGVPEYIGISSALFGEETIWLNNLLLMEFSYKTWNNLRIPLQYVALMYPYATQSAFAQMVNAWNKNISVQDSDTVIPLQAIQETASSWTRILRNDSRIIYWIAALSALSDNHGVLESEFAGLPDYLLHQVARDDDIYVTVNDSSEVWNTRDQETLFCRFQNSNETSWKLSLPETGNGYLPSFTYSYISSDHTFNLKLEGSYRRSVPEISRHSDDLPASLLDFSVSADSLPAFWPCNSSFSASIYSKSIILPEFYFECEGSSSDDGSFSVRISKPSGTENTERTILSCSGRIEKNETDSVPDYSLSDLRSHESVFTINDKTMDDFIHRIRRPLFLGILDFLNEVPPKACQSIMDDLEDYGVLDMISIEQ